MTERDPHRHRAPESTLSLPPELVTALADSEYACVTVGTDHGTSLLLKVPAHEIETARGSVPVRLGHELYDHPQAPVIRLALRIYDQPATPLALETFLNVADDAHRADYAALGEQDEIPMVFLDEHCQPRLTKRISHSDRAVVPELLDAAERLLRRIPPEQFDFEAAKQAVMEATGL